MNKFRTFELVPIFCILGLGLVVLFQEVVFYAEVLVPADIMVKDPILREAIPNNIKKAQNPLLWDHIVQVYVWHQLAAQSMQNTGHIPLWNPYLLAGQPLLANSQPALFYLPNLLLFRFSPGLVANVRIFFNILVAGVFTYLFCRELSISRTGAALSAIAFAFSGAVMVGPGYAYANSLVWLPFLMWSMEKMFDQSRIWFWGLVTSIGIGMSILGGHPETVFHNLLVLWLYFWARLFFLGQNPRGKVHLGMTFLLANLFGLMLAAVQWLPFASFLSQSWITTRTRSWFVDSIFYSREWLPNFATLVTLWFPNFFGNTADYTYFWPFSSFQNYLEHSLYFGLVPLALAIGAIFAKDKRHSRVILASLALFCLAVALRFPGFEAVNFMPIFNKVNNTRLKWHFAFLMTVLAGFGLDALRVYFLSGMKENKRAFRATSMIFMIAIAILTILAFYRYIIARMINIPNTSIPFHLLFVIFSKRQPRTIISIVVIFTTVVAWWIVHKKLKLLPALIIFLLAITFIELVVIARGFNTSVTRELIFPDLKLVRKLKKDDPIFRILSIPPTFWPNYSAIYGLFDVGGYDFPVFQRYAELYVAQGGQGYRQVWSPDWPLVDWMNIKYIITPEKIIQDNLELFVNRETYKVYRNRNVLPRAYMVYDIEVIEDSQVALQELTGGAFDFRHQAIIETDLPFDQVVIEPPDFQSADFNTVRFIKFENDRVIVDVSTETPGMLVMSDVYAPGWMVRVDGKDSKLYRTNYAFRGVFLSEGDHIVSFTYRPRDFQIGILLSIVGVAIIGLGLPISYLTSNRRKDHD